MKILQISSAHSLGGGERHLADLADGLVRAGHDVYVALRPASPLINELKNVSKDNVRLLPLRNSLDAQSARALAKLVQQEQIQIVHAHMARDYPLAAYAVRRNPGARLVVTRHVLFPLNPLHRITLSRAARVIAVSESVARQLRSEKVVDPKKISVVLNGIDAAAFGRAKAEFNRKEFFQVWQIPEGSLLTGIIGELSPLKGQREFLFAAAEIARSMPNAFFVVAGIDHSPKKENLLNCEALIRQLNLGERVKLIGWINDLAQLYCALDVFVSASHTESFGLAIAEAMASGTAVVATETEGAKEIVGDRETGVLVPIDDVATLASTITALLKNAGRRAELGTAGQKRVSESFSVQRMIEATEKIYLEEIGE